jgi:hypothetical protein
LLSKSFSSYTILSFCGAYSWFGAILAIVSKEGPVTQFHQQGDLPCRIKLRKARLPELRPRWILNRQG